MNNDVSLRTIAQVSAEVESGELDPVDLAEQMLSRVAELNPQLHAYNTVTPERALGQAAVARDEIKAGQYRGPLHGIPVGIKDLLYTRGVPTTASSLVLRNFVPDHNATVVDKLESAGAVSLGKLNMTEFALSGYHPQLEVPVNPWSAEHWSGVSSSGSGVASAAGLAFATIGSDTGGSIRLPAAVNGVVGLKPTYGRVSRFNAVPLSESLDHIGPLTRSVEDAAIVLNAIAGFDANDPTSLDLKVPDFRSLIGRDLAGLRVGIDARYNAMVDPEVANALAEVAAVLAGLGAEIVEVDVSGIEEGAEHWFTLTGIEAAVYHGDQHPQSLELYGPVFRSLLEHGRACTGDQVSRAYTARGRVSQVLRRGFGDMDVLLCPSFAGPPPSLEDFPPQMVIPAEAVGPIVLYQAPFNFSGSPTLSVPMGFSSSGLPLSLQLVGRHCEESVLVQVGHAYEQATQWHKAIAPAAL